jgi:hypothetical protein
MGEHEFSMAVSLAGCGFDDCKRHGHGNVFAAAADPGDHEQLDHVCAVCDSSSTAGTASAGVAGWASIFTRSGETVSMT